MIYEQTEILNKLANYLYNGTSLEYDKAYLEYKFNPEEKWYSISSWYEKNGKNFSAEESEFDFICNNSIKLCQDLHGIMLKQTGGDWRKFVLMLNDKGESSTQFIYDKQSRLDNF